MARFQVVVGDPETGDSYQFEVEDQDATRFLGKELGDEVDGSAVGLDGYTLELTGGSDATGRPMHADTPGSGLRQLLAAGRSTGFRPTRDGERKRITVRGREVADDIAQLNATIAERGDRSIEDVLGGDGADEGDEADAADGADEGDESED